MGLGFRVLGFGVCVLGRVYSLGLRFRVYGSGFRVKGLGSRV